MKKLLAALLMAVMLLTLCACSCSDDYEIVAGERKEIQTTVIIENHAEKLWGSWYFTDNGDHFLEFFEDGTAKCLMIPEIEYTYSYDGKTLTLTTPDFTRTYECTITEDGYLTYVWDNEGVSTTEICEKR